MIRKELRVATIQYLQYAGVEPDVWKIEGLDPRRDCEKVVAAAPRRIRIEAGNGCHLCDWGHEVVDFGAFALLSGYDYPDFVVPLAAAAGDRVVP